MDEDQVMTPAEELAEAQQMVARLSLKRDAARREGRTKLMVPECDMGCRDCSRECAIATFQLEWWQKELNRQIAAPGFTHNGVSYATTMGRA